MKNNHNLQNRINQLPFELRNELMQSVRKASTASPATVYATLSGSREPNLSVLLTLKDITGFSIDDLLNPDFTFLGNLHELQPPCNAGQS